MAEAYESVLQGIEELCRAYLGAQGQQRAVRAYWEIGRRIVEHEQGGGNKGAYGKQVVGRLARDLTARFGKGFSAPLVFAMRKFALLWKAEELVEPLSWVQYRALSRVRSPHARAELEVRVRQEGLGNRELLQVLQARRMQERGPGPGLSKRPGRVGLYRLERAGTGDRAQLDAGFGIKTTLPASWELPAGIPDRAVVGVIGGSGTAGQLEVCTDLAGDWERYTYPFRVKRVIDGDTLIGVLDLGLGMALEARFRLRGLDAAERGTLEGDAAREVLAALVCTDHALTAQSYGMDAYGRWLVDLSRADGLFVNARLLEDGGVGRW